MTTVCPTSTQKEEKLNKNRGVAQLGARDIWDVEAAGSNPVTPTKKGTFYESPFFTLVTKFDY